MIESHIAIKMVKRLKRKIAYPLTTLSIKVVSYVTNSQTNW